ncbi:MAG: ATP-binding protein [Acidiferrobacter sp.]
MSVFSFHRPALARSFCDALTGQGLQDAREGLFLSAPRRVGKSTFLQEDLIPEVERRGAIPVYVDLWKDKRANPEVLIAQAIKAAIAQREGVLRRIGKAIPVRQITIGAMSFDLSTPGLPPHVTLTEALGALHALAKAPVVLIIDEAQRALSSSEGLNAMFALKAARDTLNSSDQPSVLRLVMTGSSRDKLSYLVLTRAQPFFGSHVASFPLLARDFTDALTEWANRGLAPQNRFTASEVFQAFQIVGHRPQMLREIMGSVVLDGEAAGLSAALLAGARGWQERIWEEYTQVFAALSPLQRGVLEALIRAHKTGFAPFAEASLAAYRKALPGGRVSAAGVQKALAVLRDRGLIWQETRGGYALEDEGLLFWLEATGRARSELEGGSDVRPLPR